MIDCQINFRSATKRKDLSDDMLPSQSEQIYRQAFTSVERHSAPDQVGGGTMP